MPPPSSYPALEPWFDTLVLLVTLAAPLLLAGWLAVRRRSWTAAQLAAGVIVGTATLLLLATAGWYVSPDYAGSPRAAVVSTVVLAAPALAVTAAAWLLAQRRTWPALARAAVPLVAGYGMMALCVVPALITFVQLGGDTL
jgi:hypothetical protein